MLRTTMPQRLSTCFRFTAPKTRHFVADRISYRTPPQVILRWNTAYIALRPARNIPTEVTYEDTPIVCWTFGMSWSQRGRFLVKKR